jgi:hypothetical protein
MSNGHPSTPLRSEPQRLPVEFQWVESTREDAALLRVNRLERRPGSVLVVFASNGGQSPITFCFKRRLSQCTQRMPLDAILLRDIFVDTRGACSVGLSTLYSWCVFYLGLRCVVLKKRSSPAGCNRSGFQPFFRRLHRRHFVRHRRIFRRRPCRTFLVATAGRTRIGGGHFVRRTYCPPVSFVFARSMVLFVIACITGLAILWSLCANSVEAWRLGSRKGRRIRF